MHGALTHRQADLWTEPFAALYWRIRVQSYLLVAAFVCVSILGGLLFRLGAQATSLVYVVAPDGKAIAVLDREANRAPSRAESAYVAQRFASLFFQLNSSNVHSAVAELVSLCSPALANQLRRELAEAQFVDTVRQRQIRSELSFEAVDVLEHTEQGSRVRVGGSVAVYSLTEYDSSPMEVRSFELLVVLAAVPRDPQSRVNGLEVVRIAHSEQRPRQGQESIGEDRES